MGALTAKKVESIKADPTKDQKLLDGDGLMLKVAKSGRKTFSFRYTYGRHRKELTLGTYPEVSLARARELRFEANRTLSSGKDPLLQKHQAQTALAESLTVSGLIAEFHERVLKKNFKRHPEAKALLDRDVGRILGKRLIVDVVPKDIVKVINEMIDRGSRVAANRTLALTKNMFTYAVDQQLIPINPVTITRRAAGGRESSRKRNLSMDEIKVLVHVLHPDTRDMEWQTRTALLLILLTAQRPGEVCQMEWTELRDEQKVWHIPAEKAKSGRAHYVDLPPSAIQLINAAKPFTSESKYVLASTSDPLRPIDRHSVSRAVIRLFEKGLLSMPKFTPHDLRRTVASRMADDKIAPHVIEKILNHLMEGVMSVYNQAEYREERRSAVMKWGKKCGALIHYKPHHQ